MRLEHEDLPHYLALGDLAFLVREENLVNSVSSPTKFPEYLACGLPVVISPGVGDCTEIVERMGLGVVVSTADIEAGAEKVASFIESSRAAREELRQKCRKAAFDLFTERDHDVLSGFYRALETGGGG
jgi:glycosyltransferase involved in cell wall biosynthesis